MKQKFLVLSKPDKKNPGAPKVIYLRVRDGVEHYWKIRTPFVVDPAIWDENREEAKIKPTFPAETRELLGELNMRLSALKNFVSQQYAKDSLENKVDDNWLGATLDKLFAIPVKTGIKAISQEFLQEHPLADSRKKQYEVLFRSLQRYELYYRQIHPRLSGYTLNLEDITSETLKDLWKYMRDEATILEKYSKIEEQIPTHKKADVRSTNTLIGIFKRLRAFFNWCIEAGYMKSNPFKDFHIEAELYGTPIYLTSSEVQKIYKTDLSDNPDLERQRDIFVFQCNIGCRVGDLVKFKKKDIDRGILSYIPSKTIKDNAKTVVVPLNGTAREIVRKYKKLPGDQLLPFIRAQEYNEAIKLVLLKAGIHRQVVVLDPVTRTEKKVSIAAIASSHMARRTFVGNLYKQVKDPNLVASLTGHVEGSRAFSRYRAIDTEMKKDLVNLIG